MKDSRFSTYDLGDLGEFLHRKQAQIEKAVKAASKAFLTRTRNAVAAQIAKEEGASGAAVKRIRMRVHVSRGKVGVSLWVGSNPVMVQYLGARQARRGFSTKSRAFPKAFMPWKSTGQSTIFERVSQERHPIRRPTVEVHDAMYNMVMQEWAKSEGWFWQQVRNNLQTTE